MAVVYYVLVILGKIFLFFAEFFYLIFIELKRAQPKIRAEEVKEVKECNEKVDKITDLTLTSGFLAIVLLSVLITAAG